jgi:hypothetical protein
MRVLAGLFFVALVASAADPVCPVLPPATAPNFLNQLTTYMNGWCYRTAGWEHDANVRTSDGVHPFVKIYYSPKMWKWLKDGDRQADVPDGSMLVKEQYQTLTQKQPDEWTIMAKDHTGSWDGWYWADLSAPSLPKKPGAAPANGCAEPQAPYNSFGQYCINCHSSAAAGQLTFGSTKFVNQTPPTPTTAHAPTDDLHHRHALDAKAQHPTLAASLPMKLRTNNTFANVRALPPAPVPCMVPESNDHVVSGGKPVGPEQFITSDQCQGCHDATGTLAGANRGDIPSMLYPNAQANPMVNVSPYGEWRYSMMGLSGRDPIFFAQLASERTIHAKIDGQPNPALYIEDLCLRCHGVMGERQFKMDTGKMFSRDQLNDPNSKYGALGRDGVSCTVCHHIAAEGLGKPETFTGEFKTSPPTEVYGPFKDPIPLPMKNGLGIEPKITQENQIESSALCGSCHTILLPVIAKDGTIVHQNGKPKLFYEQATYIEWLNSDFQNELSPPGKDPQTCQHCHMTTDYKGNKLSYKIANIEDNTFPAVDFRSPDKEITMQVRDPFYRHTLLGINVFALEMFGQFRTYLGLYQTDPMLPNPSKTTSSHDTAVASSLELAAKSVELNIRAVVKYENALRADVEVVNLTGHSFPSGVGFRRAFLNFELLDSAGKTVWASGNTSAEGVIVDGTGKPLVTEFFSPSQQQFQTHRWKNNPIMSEDQVQIYEELVVDPQGLLTTSFLSLDHRVKDNRLQPKGWKTNGPYADETKSVGTGADPNYTNGRGASVVSYQIPLNAKTSRASQVRATMYYQTIPPYYLRQRAETGQGPDTQRLMQFAEQLKVTGTPVANWRLSLASKTAPVQ